VHHKLKSETVDTRESFELATLEDRESFVKAPWEVLFDRGDMPLNNVIVIEHPFGPCGQRFAVVRGLRQALVYPFKNLSVVLVGLQEPRGAPTTEGAPV
jgi:hypothetical protein